MNKNLDLLSGLLDTKLLDHFCLYVLHECHFFNNVNKLGDNLSVCYLRLLSFGSCFATRSIVITERLYQFFWCKISSSYYFVLVRIICQQ